MILIEHEQNTLSARAMNTIVKYLIVMVEIRSYKTLIIVSIFWWEAIFTKVMSPSLLLYQCILDNELPFPYAPFIKKQVPIYNVSQHAGDVLQTQCLIWVNRTKIGD